jgi:translocation and assembly module TamA
MFLKRILYLIILFVGISRSMFADFFYRVHFRGLQDIKILNILKENSSLVNFEDKKIPSTNALRYRINSDVPELIRILHSYSYYDAKIDTNIIYGKEVEVIINIHPGPRYFLKSYNVYKKPCDEKQNLAIMQEISLKDLNLRLNTPVIAENVLNSENLLLEELASRSYPLATIEKRDVIVDVREKSVSVDLCTESGPFSRFGAITILGLKDINPRFIERKIAWEEGNPYNLNLISLTQKRLMQTNLFGSVLVSHTGALDESGELPMRIKLTETKHRSINIGISYATIGGPGASAGWENRNVMKMGQLLSIEADISKVSSTGSLTYKIPDFYQLNRDYIWQAMVLREDVIPFLAFTYRAGNRLEWNIGDYNKVSLGLKFEYIDVVKSISNGKFSLLALPLYFKFSNATSILDPVSGYSIYYKATPYQAISHKKSFFLKQKIIGAFYIPMNSSKKIVTALEVQLGSIAGAALFDIPFTKRFLGGSDNDLRGYRFMTVSPTNANGDPLGGRGVIYATLELRFRVTESIGIVPFTDWGNVTLKQYPTVTGKWFKSVGLGLRYFTFFGPLRLDIGVPLDKRKRDPNYRIYLSIGQTF